MSTTTNLLRLRTLPLLFAIWLVWGCRKRNSDCPAVPQYQQLSSSAKEWFPYTGNRSLTFENAAGASETLELHNYFLGDDDVWVGDECPVTKGEFLRGNIVDRVSNDTIAVELGFGDRVQIKKKIGFILYYDTRAVLIAASEYKRFQSSVILNGKTFTSVLSFKCSPSDNCNTPGITQFYFSKTRGLVAFERNGILWTLKG